LPKKELEKIFENRKSSYANKNEILEAENSIKAFKYLKDEFYFSLPQIKKLYKILTKSLVMETGDHYPKGFRKTELVVGNEKTIEPEQIKPELKKLLDWHKKNKKSYPLKLAFDFHSRYETIHPFRDANGRTGRLITNKILMQNKYPLMIVFKDNKKAYFNAIKKARENKNKEYYHFMLNQQLKSYKLTKRISEQ
ncbi:Fic family protein, partial [Candidatus Micrarchaeota archaeon]|nr:Fic family protein [Candidatus Micrarchaeota archaeon]